MDKPVQPEPQANSASPTKRKRKKWGKGRKILVVIITILICFRILLPYIVLKYVNNKLANLTDYYGHVEDIDIYLYRGAYVIKDIEIVKLDREKDGIDAKVDTTPFFKSPEIDLSVQWSALFKGRIVGEIEVDRPVLNFVKGRHKGEDVKQDTSDFRQLVKDLMPLTVNRFEIKKGEVHYIDPYSSPKIDVAIKEMYILALNLSNVNKDSAKLPATLTARGIGYEGTFNMNVKFDGLNKVPTFDMTTEFKNVNMAMLNDIWRAYANFDMKKGRFGFYSEFAARDGKFGGYVKPFLKDMDIVQWNKEEGDFKQILWETLIGTAAELLQNQRTEELATKVSINGSFDKPNINIWRAISYVLRNAFVRALKPTFDNTININVLNDASKKTFLEKVFGNKNEGDKKTRKEKRQERREERKKRKNKK